VAGIALPNFLKGGTVITLQLDETTAAQLAQFCKRANCERVEPFAANAIELGAMLRALNALREALKSQGFDPR
jgi:hypothetical protein